MHFCAKNGKTKLLKILIEAKADINLKDSVTVTCYSVIDALVILMKVYELNLNIFVI